MSNYIQPDYRNPLLQGTGVFIFQTEIALNLGPTKPANSTQGDFRNPNLGGGVVAVKSEALLVPGPSGPTRYVQPGTPNG